MLAHFLKCVILMHIQVAGRFIDNNKIQEYSWQCVSFAYIALRYRHNMYIVQHICLRSSATGNANKLAGAD